MPDIIAQYIKKYGIGKYITNQTNINCSIPMIAEMLEEKKKRADNSVPNFSQVNFICEVPERIIEKVSKELVTPFVENEEGYVIDVDEDIAVYSWTERGLFYGAVTLLRIMKKQYVDRLLAYDYPVCSTRGVKIYLPSEKNIEYFKQFIDMICYYKYNTVMIEVGGAMEYKKHPEINNGWVEYCKEMSEYSGKTTQIQEKTFPWYKNSIHVENGEGGYLDQDTVRELVDYCKNRMLNVIPEVPCLSHCDYLLLGHHEIAERQDDPYPDTYCPSNPKSYELLFEILDEIIEVFNPTMVNVGHDEYYSIGVCEKCKERKAEEIFAEDIKRIHEFLASRGIMTMIWGDKLLENCYSKRSGFFGGAEVKMHRNWDIETGEYLGTIPATYKAIDLIPQNIKILHWIWGHGVHAEKLEEQYLERSMEVTYGNFGGITFPDWSRRIKAGIKGAIISNWSTLSEIILQRNGVLFDIVYSYFMFWDKDYEDAIYDEIRNKTLEELFTYKHKRYLELDEADSCRDGIHYIEIVHTTDYSVDYKGFFDGVFIEEDIYRIGDYVISYADNTKAEVPIIYGENISSRDVSWERKNGTIDCYYEIDKRLAEVSLTTLPVRDGDSTWYRYVFTNPRPEKRIKNISVKNRNDKNCNIWIKSINLM